MHDIQTSSCSKLSTNETMRCTGIKQDKDRLVMNRECTGHDWCTLWKFCHGGVVEPSLLHLEAWLLALVAVVVVVVVVVVGALTLVLLLWVGTFPGEVGGTPTVETAVVGTWRKVLRDSWPWSIWLRHWGSSLTLLLRRSDNPSSWLRGSLRSFWRSSLHNLIPRGLNIRWSGWRLALLLGPVGSDAVFLSDGHVDELIVALGPDEI